MRSCCTFCPARTSFRLPAWLPEQRRAATHGPGKTQWAAVAPQFPLLGLAASTPAAGTCVPRDSRGLPSQPQLSGTCISQSSHPPIGLMAAPGLESAHYVLPNRVSGGQRLRRGSMLSKDSCACSLLSYPFPAGSRAYFLKEVCDTSNSDCPECWVAPKIHFTRERSVASV